MINASLGENPEVKLRLCTKKKIVEGCPVLWTFETEGAQQMIFFWKKGMYLLVVQDQSKVPSLGACTAGAQPLHISYL